MTTSSPRILAFAGSARADSFNKKLIQVAAQGARDAGAQVTLIDLAEYPMPIYDGDKEAQDGIPDNAHALKALFKSHHGFLLACPEYNGSITPLLKNVIDWVSRPIEGESKLECYQGKVAALISASPGSLGGTRGLAEVRRILSGIGTTVIAENVSVPKSHEAFTDSGALADDGLKKRLEGVCQRLVEVAGAVGITTP